MPVTSQTQRETVREIPAELSAANQVKKLTRVHPGRRLKTLGRRVLAEGRHPRVLRPRFLPKVVEALHLLLLLSVHGYVWLVLRRLNVAEVVEPKLGVVVMMLLSRNEG